MEYITHITVLFVGVFIGFALCALLTINRDESKSEDTARLDFIADKRAHLGVAHGGEVYGVLAGTPLALIGQMAPDPRTAIDSARSADKP